MTQTVIDVDHRGRPTALLTTDSSASSYGRPVLRILDADGYYPAGDYGPDDVLHGPDDDPFGVIQERANDYAGRCWASRIMEGGKLSETDPLCAAFCGQPIYSQH